MSFNSKSILRNHGPLAMVFFLAFILGSCGGGMGKNKTFTLKFNPKVGDVYNSTLKMNSTLSSNMMGQEMIIPIIMEMDIKKKVLSPEGELAVVETIYNRIKMKMDNPMISLDYDSENPSENPSEMTQAMTTVFGAMIGKATSSLHDQRGEIKERRGWEELLEEMGDGGDGLDESFTRGFDSYVNLLPEGPLQIGHSFVQESQNNSGGTAFIAVNTYTITDRKDGKVFFDLKGTVKPDLKALEDNPNIDGMEMTGSQVGTLVFEEKSGVCTSGIINQDFVITISTMGMEIPTTLKGNISFDTK